MDEKKIEKIIDELVFQARCLEKAARINDPSAADWARSIEETKRALLSALGQNK